VFIAHHSSVKKDDVQFGLVNQVDGCTAAWECSAHADANGSHIACSPYPRLVVAVPPPTTLPLFNQEAPLLGQDRLELFLAAVCLQGMLACTLGLAWLSLRSLLLNNLVGTDTGTVDTYCKIRTWHNVA
jgi:predicted NAD/FAD-dependent oxidoreductase